MVSPIDAFASLAAANNTPPNVLQSRSSATDAADDRVPDANAPPRDGDPAPTAPTSGAPAVNRFNEAVEPPAGVREGIGNPKPAPAGGPGFVATARIADAFSGSETPPPPSGLAAVTAEARGAHVDVAV